MKTPLSLKLIGFYATVATVTAFVTLWVGEMLVERQLTKATDLMLDTEFSEIQLLLLDAAPPYNSESVTRQLQDHTLIDATIFYFQVNAPDGKPLFKSRNLAGISLPEGAVGTHHAALLDLSLHTHGPEGMPVRIGHYEHEGIQVTIASILAAQKAVQRQFHLTMATAVPIVFLLSLAVGYLMSQVMLKPLRNIQNTAQRIGASNLKERIPVPGSGDELSHLATLLNHAFDRIEASFEQIRRFTSDCSHELKTPLSIVRLHAERIAEDEQVPAPHRESLRELLGEVSRLEKVINQLLILARTDSATFTLDVQEIDTAEYLEQFREDAEALAESENHRFILEQNDPGRGRLDPSWMRQVLFNLLSNAIRYSPKGGEIRLSSSHDKKGWQLIMEDDGPGVPEEEARDIFNRFIKIRRTDGGPEGTGLGLAVCKSIIELHGGCIEARPRRNGSPFAIAIQLPASPVLQ